MLASLVFRYFKHVRNDKLSSDKYLAPLGYTGLHLIAYDICIVSFIFGFVFLVSKKSRQTLTLNFVGVMEWNWLGRLMGWLIDSILYRCVHFVIMQWGNRCVYFLFMQCEGIVEDNEDEIVEVFKDAEEENYLQKICVDLSGKRCRGICQCWHVFYHEKSFIWSYSSFVIQPTAIYLHTTTRHIYMFD